MPIIISLVQLNMDGTELGFIPASTSFPDSPNESNATEAIWYSTDGLYAIEATGTNMNTSNPTISSFSEFLISDESSKLTISGLSNSLASIESTATYLAANDSILASFHADQLRGFLGSDTIGGGEGNDTIYGGSARADSDDSADLLNGEGGNDDLFGNSGNDTMYGGSQANGTTTGNDRFYGGVGADEIHGQDGANWIAGGGSRAHPDDDGDLIYGGTGGDVILGNGGNDTIYGGAQGNESVNDGGNAMAGGVGDDIIVGTAGSDRILGQNGSDTLTSGSATDGDIFFHYTTDGNDVITDFVTAEQSGTLGDQLHISTATGLNSFAEVEAAGAVVDGNFVITFASGGTLTLQGQTGISNNSVFVIDQNDPNLEQSYFEPFYLDW